MKYLIYLTTIALILSTGYFLWDRNPVEPVQIISTEASNEIVNLPEDISQQADFAPESKRIQSDGPVNEQNKSVDFVTSDTSNSFQSINNPSPSQLAAEIMRVYNLAVEQDDSGQDTVETMEYLYKLIEDLKLLPETDFSLLLYHGELPDEIFDLGDFKLNLKIFLPLQNFINSPLSEVGKSSNSSIVATTEMGISFGSSDNDAISTYMYSKQGNFSGIVNIMQDMDLGMRYLVEEIRGVDVMRFAGSVNFLVSNISEPITFFFKGNSVDTAAVQMSEVNSTEHITLLLFPISSSTRGSVTISRENDTITVGKWNFDFNGDNITDISIGNGKEFTYEEYETTFDIMGNDTTLSSSDQALLLTYKKALFDFIKAKD